MAALSITSAPRVRSALRARGWNGQAEPERWLREHARAEIDRWRTDAARAGVQVDTLDQVRRIAADRLKVQLIEIESDEQLRDQVQLFCSRGELAFKTIEDEFGGQVEGAIVRLSQAKPWERPLVAVIDARGQRRFARYFCSCHEIGHPFLEPQLEFNFRCRADSQDPLERAVDLVAGEIAFHTPLALPLLRSLASRDLTYDAVERFWLEHASFASRTAAFLAAIRLWEEPALLVIADIHSAKHGRDQGLPALRVSKCLPNGPALAQKLFIPQFRVPEGSGMHAAFEDPAGASHERTERLDSWRSSNGKVLKAQAVRVGSRRVGRSVFAVMRF